MWPAGSSSLPAPITVCWLLLRGNKTEITDIPSGIATAGNSGDGVDGDGGDIVKRYEGVRCLQCSVSQSWPVSPSLSAAVA